MSHSTSESVECPLCGEQFDPTAAGGWCTNSDCGEWQYEAAAEAVAQSDEQGDEGENANEGAGDKGADESDSEERIRSEPSESEPSESDEVVPDAEFESESESAADTDTTEDVETDEQADEPAGAPADAGDGGEPDEPELACPNCGESVAAEHNFCVNCGEDVSALEPGPLTECPSCDGDVEPEDSFCATCGEDLDAHRAGASEAGDDAGATPEDSGDADSGGDAPDDRAVETAGDETAPEDATAAEADASAAASGDDAPESLVLVVRNREVQVWDGDTVGRTIRSVVMNTGGDEDDAVRIHREHVKFVREDGGFHLVALGQNPTVVNGDSLDEGERVAVSPGDRIELSDVARIRVEAP